ncbi:Cysteine synthase [Flexistipes sinusarabici DSM 4947]|uniref:Cysteine synthase n=1 Tax=Flexistipes sinusarabici (strain ATCC 49648 / DSM 4947 / MAS 10) TaxID=717231 RepID=F8E9S6_FLESM|nr:aminotransferase class V-fold PLP-dependent enzyme [Flexistipes sinusarabici]AEI14259.1 Cysteine synthase [Flexistipes sinusarabici DSM 4947]
MKDLTTKIFNTDFPRKDPYGSIHFPVYDNVAFEFENSEELARTFAGKTDRHVYSRITNPTVAHLENRIKNLTGSLNVIATSSGMAAIANTVLALVQNGDNIVCSKYIFGNTYSLLNKTIKKFGVETRFVDPCDVDEISEKTDDKTRIIFMETITNPQMVVCDVEKISEIAGNSGAVFVMDTTATPPPVFEALEYGVDIEIISSTKYISGGATSVGGLIIDYGTFDWSQNPCLENDYRKFGPYTFTAYMKNEVHRNLGTCLSPHNAYLQNLGLETMQLRIEKSCSNAVKIAKSLLDMKRVKKVNYPGLYDGNSKDMTKKYFNGNPGSIITFELESRETCFGFMDNLNLIKKSTNIHDNRTLIIHPASTIFTEYPAKERENLGVSDSLIRLSVGIESFDDLTNDIKQALDKEEVVRNVK